MGSKYKIGSLAVIFVLFFLNSIAQNTHPAWSTQSNIYEVNLRQYTPEGTFKAFEKHLPRLKKMGVEILWFMPITPIGKDGRKMDESQLGSYYSVRNYKEVNEEFGTMADFKIFVKHAHSLGFKVITDWVPNHSSPDNPWIKNHPNFYKRDKNGNTTYDEDYTDTRNLDYTNKELRDTMIEVMKFWLKETNMDGFRCDHVDPLPLDFWKQCIKELKKVKNIFMLAESEIPEMHTAGFDETYTWSVMNAMTDLYTHKKTLWQFDSLLKHNILIFPKNAYHLYFTTNHDENSWNGTEFEKYGDAYKAFAVFTQTFYQSVPLIYNGQEIPNKRRLKFFVKDTIQWTGFEMAPFYKTLLALRKSNIALSADAAYKKLVTANDVAIFAYTREKNNHKVAVILNLSNQSQSFTIKDESIYGKPMNVFSKTMESLSRMHVYNIEPWGYIVYDYNR